MATIVEFEGKRPQIHESVFVASTAVLIGDVVLDKGASVWYGAVLRGDSGIIRIGKDSNVQDNVVIHADTEHGTIIGNRVTLGHGCILHDTNVGDGCVI
ncbi:MAG: gamma carbonic anhydrase family protein, partial [Pseudomonadota bacterium]|nr:gamma carbonic anhydrase family protein [Pseudomonadota bacterium]